MPMAALPSETLAHVVSFLLSWKDRRQLLALRAASPFYRDAVERALLHAHLGYGKVEKRLDYVGAVHTMLERFERICVANEEADAPADPHCDPRAIVAWGRVFGRACRDLSFSGSSTEALRSIRSLVRDTKGGLTELDVINTSISVEGLLEICRASPLLEDLFISLNVPHIYAAMDDALESFATSMSRACPLLRSFEFGDTDASLGLASSSPAEYYARFFPNLAKLDFTNWRSIEENVKYCPSDLDNIEEACRRCLNATEWTFENCLVTPPLITRMLTTPLCSRVRKVVLQEARVSSSSVLQLAAGCPMLRMLDVMNDVPDLKTPAFFEALSSTRPELTELILHLADNPAPVNDVCLRFIGRLGLEHLCLTYQSPPAPLFTAAGVDALIAGTCASSLLSFTSFHPSLGASLFLRLARECPKLTYLSTGLAPWPQPLHEDAKLGDAILNSRPQTPRSFA